jgi:hypothetical protein
MSHPNECYVENIFCAIMNRPKSPHLFEPATHEHILNCITDLESRGEYKRMIEALNVFFWMPMVLTDGADRAYDIARRWNVEVVINMTLRGYYLNGGCSGCSGCSSGISPQYQLYHDVIRHRHLTAYMPRIRELYKVFVADIINHKAADDMTDEEYIHIIHNFLCIGSKNLSIDSEVCQTMCMVEYTKIIAPIRGTKFCYWLANKPISYITNIVKSIAIWILNIAAAADTSWYISVYELFMVVNNRRMCDENMAPCIRSELMEALTDLVLAMNLALPKIARDVDDLREIDLCMM